MFSREVIEITLFRFRYTEDSTKLVEILRKPIKLKPFLSDVAGKIDLIDMGNEFPPPPSTSLIAKRYKQEISIIPIDESELFGENYDGQFFRHEGSLYNVAVQHTISKDDSRIVKKMWSFEIDIPSLNGWAVFARFKGRLRTGRFTTVLKGQGMWKYYEGGERGDLYVQLIVK